MSSNQATTNAEILIQLLITAISQAGQISQLLQNAQSQGRDVTDAELDQLFQAADSAKQKLEADIAAMKASATSQQPQPAK